MLTFTDWKNTLRRFTGLSDTELTNYGTVLLNDGRVRVLSAIDTYITEQNFLASTVASQQNYALPIGTFKVEDISVLVGTIRYSPMVIVNPRQWDIITTQNSVVSNIPTHVYIDNNKMAFWPTPASNGNIIRAIVTSKEADITNEDATGGTIAITNGSATVTGTGTNFLPTQVGWQLNTPDNNWYEVLSVQSTTSLTLTKLFEGPTTSGANYRLGQASMIPEEGQILPVYYAAMTHFLSLEKPDKAGMFRNLYLGTASVRGTYVDGLMGLIRKYSNKTESVLNNFGDGVTLRNKNNYPFLGSNNGDG